MIVDLDLDLNPYLRHVSPAFFFLAITIFTVLAGENGNLTVFFAWMLILVKYKISLFFETCVCMVFFNFRSFVLDSDDRRISDSYITENCLEWKHE